ncbi:TolC family protein, partial [Legionella pneumophila]|uniref:TolC family protein n=1 Tax=Legionella pneumophila TaxID=446 RepID=UPI000778320D
FPPEGTGTGINQLVGINAVIDADLFGRLKQTRLRAKAYLEVEESTQQFTLLNLQTEIANSYIELRETQERRRILHYNRVRSMQLLSVINSRYHNGFCDYVDVVQQKSLISVLQSDTELADGLAKILIHKLEILTGNLPGALNKTLSHYRPIPTSTKKINLGIPSSLLNHRPDIIAAERRVAAAHANINIAMTSLFPQLSLGWLLAWQTRLISTNLISFANPQSTFFGTFNAPLFDLSAYRNLDVQKQEKILLVIQYELTVLNALHEVENQYTNYIHYKASTVYLKKAAQQKQLALKLTKEKYQKGLTSYDTLFRLQDDLNHIELSYVHNVSLMERARINLYNAIGNGSWRPMERKRTLSSNNIFASK